MSLRLRSAGPVIGEDRQILAVGAGVEPQRQAVARAGANDRPISRDAVELEARATRRIDAVDGRQASGLDAANARSGPRATTASPSAPRNDVGHEGPEAEGMTEDGPADESQRRP